MPFMCDITWTYALDEFIFNSLETYFGNRLTFWLLLFKIKSSTRPPSTCIYIISYCRFFAFINVHEQMQRCLKQMGCCIWSIYVKFVNQLYFMGWETNEFARRRWEIQTGFRKKKLFLSHLYSKYNWKSFQD